MQPLCVLFSGNFLDAAAQGDLQTVNFWCGLQVLAGVLETLHMHTWRLYGHNARSSAQKQGRSFYVGGELHMWIYWYVMFGMGGRRRSRDIEGELFSCDVRSRAGLSHDI